MCASDTIRNATIRSREKLAEVALHVPLDKDLDAVIDILRSETAAEPRSEVLVSSLNEAATITVRAWAPDAEAVERIESDLRLRILRRLRENSLL
jgi:small-conductance mechanosensitive channel